jgi:hypothetical protein
MGQEVKKCDELKTGEELKTPEEPKPEKITKTGEELRRAPRLQCSGLAGVQTLPACNKPVPAKIMNLSIGGCLMELERPLTLVVDEIVELIFCVNQMPFRVRGKVRALRTEKLVGFQFPLLSDRVRLQLEELIGELIDHLARLHKESLTHRPAQNDGKQPHASAARAAQVGGMLYPIRPDEGQQDNTGHRPEPHRRWS